MAERLLIRNAVLVNEGRRQEADLVIKAGRIERIGGDIAAPAGAEVVDADGRWVLPGMIDDQVHFREPGLERKGDLQSESAAAAAGGITSVMEMPNTNPPTTSLEQLREKYRRAEGRMAVNYSFYLGATNDNIDEIRRMPPDAGCGIKVFMGASTGNMLVDDQATLEAIFRDAPTIVATHCEDTPRIERNLAAARERYGDRIPARAHAEIRDVEACWLSSSRAVDLARRHGTRLHVLHLTTARELQLFDSGPVGSKSITAEACVHHLYFSDADYAELGNRIKCNPAIKTAADRDALIQALGDERLDIIATDHAPHLPEEKLTDDYMQAAAGLPLAEFALPCALELCAAGRLSIEQLVDKTAHNPSERFGLSERGYLREGYWADLVLVDPRRPLAVDRRPALSKCGWSPFAGRTFTHSIAATWVNGALAWDGNALLGTTTGIPHEFQR